ncbi:MAG: HTTM domain-containing protein [Kofleriaceae bacterium]
MAKKRKRSGGKSGEPSIAKPASTPAKDEHVASIGSAKKATPAKHAKHAKQKHAKAVRDEDPSSKSFWFGFEIAWAKLLVARFVIFGLLAVDALLQISHAPRYGAGGFNVAHMPGLDDLGAGRASFAIAQLVIAYMLAFAALGVRTRVVLPIATALYAWVYFGSQLDSYQHHYLVALVLLLSCFVPWERPAEATPRTPVRSWALRLILVQLGIMYAWAAISKMDAAWLDGRTLDLQISGAMRSIIDDTIGIKAASRFALLAEIILALTIWWKRTWVIALPLGVAFHAGILASGLEIGLFAVLMLGFYVLVMPDRAFAWVGERLARVFGGVARAIGRALSSWIAAGVALAIGIALALIVRLPSATAVGLGLAGMCAAFIGYTRERTSAAGIARAHLFAMVVWLVVDRASSTAVDYYRFWGGNSRRLGDPAASEYAYRKVIEIDPENAAGHYQLGKLLLARDEDTAGLAELREAQRLEPARARAYLAEAEWLKLEGRVEEALAKAKEATYAEPTHPQAQRFLSSLTGAAQPGPPPEGKPGTDDATDDASDDAKDNE